MSSSRLESDFNTRNWPVIIGDSETDVPRVETMRFRDRVPMGSKPRSLWRLNRR
jgi:hypothetical protein